MHHPRIRHPGPDDFWRNSTPVEPWEAEAFDGNAAAGVNGDDGETFSAETQIAIGGAGIVVTAPFRASDVRRMTLTPATPLSMVVRTLSRFGHVERGTPEDPDDWLLQTTSNWRPHWRQLTTTQIKLWIPMSLPLGSTLTELRMTLSGAAAHAALPASMPKISIAINNTTDSITPAIASTTTDSSASTAIYQDWHHVTRAGSHAVTANRRFWAHIEGESGVNSLNSLRVVSVRATVDMSTHDEWLL